MKTGKKKIVAGAVAAALVAGVGVSAVPKEHVYTDTLLSAQAQLEMTERDWNSVTIPLEATVKKEESWLLPDKIIDVKPTKFQTEFHGKWVNYLTTYGDFEEIRPAFILHNNNYAMINAPFSVYAPLRSNGTAKFYNDNQFDPQTKKQITAPPLIMNITALGIADVPGELAAGDLGWGDTQYVIYRQAYPDYDADLIYWVHQGVEPTLRKLIRFNSAAKAPDATAKFSFKISYDQPVSLYRDVKGKRTKWTGATALKNYQGSIDAQTDLGRAIGFDDFKIWDSNDKMALIKVDVVKQDAQTYLLSKKIEPTFFKNAAFPVYTDTTSTFFPDPNVESTSVDGYVLRAGVNQTFTDIRSGAGNGASDSADGLFFRGAAVSATATLNQYGTLYRSIYLFDTSAIPDSDTISSATFSIVGGNGDGKSNGLGSLDFSLVASTPASNTALANADYGNLGTTRYATDIAYASFTSDGSTYNDMALNATGLANVTATGVTKFGARLANDVDNSDPTWSSGAESGYEVLYADTTGTTKDPKLVVVHASASRRIIITE